MAENDGVIFDRLGGPEGVAAILQDMYERVLADPDLAPFFENTSMDRLRQMQYQFVASAFDGPVAYTGAELNAVHAGRGITRTHFSKFCGHFLEAMRARSIDPTVIDQALGRLATYADKVTGDANVDG
ncbi:Group 1 truncated hemoglobin GlbN [Rubripirellula lacrimiformis]|uniref:Group 1 truncated hemoglobin GlbN n=1 Tax=Rubripirellula lacrimiformis TaxID=1930273 RepID=A0A517N9N4_9BACT|nr:group 1 truncated hemoglobin [Rubripirellula lacrimiformis]QDT03845.1 Group 1 truncated hemoglobin GlbN [Rubripirellula lacrimiformis]